MSPSATRSLRGVVPVTNRGVVPSAGGRAFKKSAVNKKPSTVGTDQNHAHLSSVPAGEVSATGTLAAGGGFWVLMRCRLRG